MDEEILEKQKMSTEAKVDFIGEELTQEVYRAISLTRVMQDILRRVESLEARYDVGNHGIGYEMRNELTYLHNEVVANQKLLGLLGNIPKVKGEGRYGYY